MKSRAVSNNFSENRELDCQVLCAPLSMPGKSKIGSFSIYNLTQQISTYTVLTYE